MGAFKVTFDRFSWMNAWVDDESLSTGAVAVLAVLFRHMGDDGKAWPSRNVIAAKAGYSKAQKIDRYLAEIVEAGYIQKAMRGHATSLYIAAVPEKGASTPSGCQYPKEVYPKEVHLKGVSVPQTGTGGVPQTGTGGVPQTGTGGVPQTGTLTDQRTDHRTDHRRVVVAEAIQTPAMPEQKTAAAAQGEAEGNGFILPPDTDGERSDWMPKLQSWVMELLDRENVPCSIADAGAIVQRIAISKLTSDERISYLSDDITAKAGRIQSGAVQARMALKYIGTAGDIARWKDAQKPKEQPQGSTTRYRVPNNMGTTPRWIKDKEMAEAYGYTWDRG